MMRLSKTIILMLICVALAGCAVGKNALTMQEPKEDPLRVGITPNSPPVIFKLGGKITGMEAAMADRLGAELSRPVQFVELGWDQQIPALLEGKIDIIMSGMTITSARKVRIAFAEPYLKSGLLAAIRARDASKYRSAKDIMATHPAVGMIKGTTSEAFVRRDMPLSPRIVAFSNMADAAAELRSGRIEVFIYDAPAIVWFVSENEGEFTGVWELLNEEDLGWGVRQDDQELLLKVNTVLEKWKKNGTLDEIIDRWLPYWKKLH